MDSKNAVALASAAVILLAVGFIGAEVGVPSQTTTTSSRGTTATSTTGGGTGSPNGLQLRLSVGGSTATGGQASMQIKVEEYNSLASVSNVTKADNWQLSGLSLGACGNEVYPFGAALYRGVYTADNVSTAKPIQIHPILACPLMIRYISAYLFQPTSDMAVVLPSSPGASVVEMAANVTANSEYGGSASYSSSVPLHPGTYTVAAGDEWGAAVLTHFTISAGSGTSTTTTATASKASSTTGTTSLGTLLANFSIGPTAPVCRVNSPMGPAPAPYSSIEAMITSQQSGQALTIPISWLSDGCAVSGSLQTPLAPGAYSLNLSPCQFMGCQRALPRSFTIVSGQTASFSVSIDTGIR